MRYAPRQALITAHDVADRQKRQYAVKADNLCFTVQTKHGRAKSAPLIRASPNVCAAPFKRDKAQTIQKVFALPPIGKGQVKAKGNEHALRSSEGQAHCSAAQKIDAKGVMLLILLRRLCIISAEENVR